MPLPEPLSRHRLLHSSDVDEARLRIGELLSPHQLDPISRADPLDARLNFVSYGSVGLAYLSYGTEVRIQSDPTGTVQVVLIPLSGRSVVRSGSTEVSCSSSVGAILDPDLPTDIHSYAGNTHLAIRIDRAAWKRHLQLTLGHESPSQLRMAMAMPLNTAPAKSWMSTVNLLRADAEAADLLHHPMLQPHLERLMMTQLLMAATNNVSEQLIAGQVPFPPPRPIRKAEQLIIDHAREELTVEDIAEAVGLSVRTLQEGFRRYMDTTPLARLREARMAGAHAELAAADPTQTTVSNIATEWGFWHLGRFSVTYRERWGVSPSETLRS